VLFITKDKSCCDELEKELKMEEEPTRLLVEQSSSWTNCLLYVHWRRVQNSPTGMAATYSKQPSPEMPPNHVILIFNPSKEKLRGNFVFILHVLADFQLNPEIIHFINFISSVVEFLNGVIFY
jgi:hypothetical protein